MKKLKQAIVGSFVGAIALGWLLAQGILHLAGIISAPVSGWILRTTYSPYLGTPTLPRNFMLQDALPELARSASILLLWYILLRWLYFAPVDDNKPTLTEIPSVDAGTF